MATQIIHFESDPDCDTVKLFAYGTDTLAATGSSVTMGTADPSHGTCEVEDIAAGLYKVVSYAGTDPIAYQFVDLLLAAGSYYCRDSVEADARTSTRAVPGDQMALVDDAITASKYDETTAFPLKSADAGSTAVARTGADGDTLETLSDQLDTAQADLDLITGVDGATLATEQGNYAPAKAGAKMNLVDAPNETAITAIQSGLAKQSALVESFVINAGNTGWITVDNPTGELAQEEFFDGVFITLLDVSTGTVNQRYIDSHFLSDGDAGFNPNTAFSFMPVAGDIVTLYKVIRPAANVQRWRNSQPGNLDGNGFVPANFASLNGNTGRATKYADFADSKTSISEATQTAAAAALTAYDPPTRTETTEDKEQILDAIGATPRLTFGEGEPDVGYEGTDYLDTLTGDVYIKAEEEWSKVGNLRDFGIGAIQDQTDQLKFDGTEGALLSESTNLTGIATATNVAEAATYIVQTLPSASDNATSVWAFPGGRTLSSFGTLVADIVAAIWSGAERTLTAFTHKVTVATNEDKAGYALETAPPTKEEISGQVRAELSTELGRIDETVSSRASAETVSDIFDKQEEHDDRFDGLDQDATGIINDIAALSQQVAEIAGTSGGSGARAVVLTITDGENPIQGAKVRVTSGLESYLLISAFDGTVEFSLDDNTFNLAVTKPGYFYAATSLLVEGDVSQTIEMTPVATPQTDPNLVNGYVQCLDTEGEPESGVTVIVAMDDPPETPGISYDADSRTFISDEMGMVIVPSLAVGARYSIRRGDGSFTSHFRVSSTDPFPIPSFRGKP